MKVTPDDFVRAAQRMVKGDFLEPIATDAEREELAAAAAPVKDAQVQDYVAWRRSLLLISGALLILAFLFDLFGFQSAEDAFVEPMLEQARKSNPNVDEDRMRREFRKGFGEDNLDTLDGYGALNVLGGLAVTILVCLAAWRWSEVHTSRKFSRLGWYVAVGTPLLLSIVPWMQFLDFKHMGQQGEQFKYLFAAMFALQIFGTIGPKVLSIFPGVMRAGMTLKTLFHESATPAYFTTLAAPVFAMILLMLMSTVIQIEGKLTLFVAVAAFLGSSVVYLWKSRDLLRSHTKQEAGETVKGVRRLGAAFSGLGVLMLVIFLFEMEGLSFADALGFLIHAGANLLLTMVVASDFLLAVLDKEFQLAKQFQGSKFAAAYEKKMATLAAAGLTTLRAAPTPPPSETET